MKKKAEATIPMGISIDDIAELIHNLISDYDTFYEYMKTDFEKKNLIFVHSVEAFYGILFEVFGTGKVNEDEDVVKAISFAIGFYHALFTELPDNVSIYSLISDKFKDKDHFRNYFITAKNLCGYVMKYFSEYFENFMQTITFQ